MSLRARSPDARGFAVRCWHSLLEQEDASRVYTEQVVDRLTQFNAPKELLALAGQIVIDETRHVALCEQVIVALGFEVVRAPNVSTPITTRHDLLEQALAEVIVAGFAVGETMSVGGFVSALVFAKEPLIRQALKELARDEVRHGQFGEAAGKWILCDWSTSRRQSLWPACVHMMESFERRFPSVDAIYAAEGPFAEALGAPAPAVTHYGLLRAVERSVLPRLTRLGVLPLPM